jgi:serine/threonine-protein kinase
MLVPSADGPPRAIVMDFGLAQAAASDAPLKDDGTPLVAGTLGYMAPEQLAGGVATAAVDVYAFGVVLHEMLTGVLPPFRPAIARRDKTAPPPPPPSLLDTLDIPSLWSALIRRCLEREPAARFRNILEARDAVAIASGRKLSRRAALAAVAGAGALAAAVGVTLWKQTSAGPVTPVAATAPSAPAASPPVAPSSGAPARSISAAEPAPSTRAAEPPPTLAKTERPATASSASPTRARRPAPSARGPAKPESASRAAGQTPAADRPGPAPSIADTDQALDPFRESR